MNRTFDFYEYAGVIVPGAVLVTGLLFLFPENRYLIGKDGLTFGEFGAFVIIAYAAGHLVQSIGNFVDWVFWKLAGGLPSTRMLRLGTHLSPDQHKLLLSAIQADFGVTESDLKRPATNLQLPVTRVMYGLVADAKKSQRIDTFLGNYGLGRGLAAALLVLLTISIGTLNGAATPLVIFFLFVLALQRMRRFGWHYAFELVTQYLSARPS